MELDLWRNLLATAIVFALLGFVVYKFGRFPGAASALLKRSNLLNQERLRLTPQHSVHLVGVGSRSWLIACHPNGTTLLGEVSPAVAPAEAVPAPLTRSVPA